MARRRICAGGIARISRFSRFKRGAILVAEATEYINTAPELERRRRRRRRRRRTPSLRRKNSINTGINQQEVCWEEQEQEEEAEKEKGAQGMSLLA